jgi:hypothetical protein
LDQILKQYKDGDKVKIYIEDGEVKKEKISWLVNILYALMIPLTIPPQLNL